MSQISLQEKASGETIRTFPVEGTNLARILSDDQYRRTFHAQLKRYNPWIVALYKVGLLPLFGVDRSVMVLITRGRKSRKLRGTPIGYFRIGGVVHIFSAWGKSTSWYKNLTASPGEVWFQIGLRKQAVRAEPLEERAEIQQTLVRFINESPEQAHSILGWETGRDQMGCADFSAVIERVLIVRFVEKTDSPKSF